MSSNSDTGGGGVSRGRKAEAHSQPASQPLTQKKKSEPYHHTTRGRQAEAQQAADQEPTGLQIVGAYPIFVVASIQLTLDLTHMSTLRFAHRKR